MNKFLCWLLTTQPPFMLKVILYVQRFPFFPHQSLLKTFFCTKGSSNWELNFPASKQLVSVIYCWESLTICDTQLFGPNAWPSWQNTVSADDWWASLNDVIVSHPSRPLQRQRSAAPRKSRDHSESVSVGVGGHKYRFTSWFPMDRVLSSRKALFVRIAQEKWHRPFGLTACLRNAK